MPRQNKLCQPCAQACRATARARSTALKTALSPSESQPSATSSTPAAALRRWPQLSDARREQHEPAEQQRFLNKSAPPPPSIEPPPEPSRAWPQARADATPSPRHVAAISTHARAAALRRSPRSTTERCPIRRSTRPRAAAAPRADALATIRRVSDPRFVDADVEGTDPSLRVPDVHGSRRARLAPQRPSGRTTGRSGCRRRDVQHYCVAALGSHSRTCRRRRARCVARV